MSCASPAAPLDLVVVGAGPHSLSLLTRLADDEPDLMTEAERGKMMLRHKTMRPHSAVRRHLKKCFDPKERLPRTVVVDSNGGWMSQWSKDFKALGIDILRSHVNLHPEPFDFQSLVVWAARERRESELLQMGHVDREACRRAGFYGPFELPGTRLFLDFCADLVDRYGLDSLLMKGTVVDVKLCKADGEEVR